MDRAVIYCRLSVEDLEKRGESESIQNQKLLLLDYAKNQNWEVTNIYVDEDYSGMDQERPAFLQMLRDAEERRFSIILCKTQSRFTRDMETLEKYVHGLFLEWGIRFVAVVDRIDTAISGNKKARQINGLMNEWYCEDLSENIRAVLKKKMEAGQFIGSFAPYGYRKDPLDHHRLLPDPEAAEIVRKIFFLCRNGYGVYAISRKLTEEGVLPPSRYKTQQGIHFFNPHAPDFDAWSPGTVARILKNPVYTGTLVQGKEQKVSYKSKRVIVTPKAQWIFAEDVHEAIIAKSEFSEVQQLLAGRRLSVTNQANHHPSFLAGKIFCRDCGAPMQRAAPTRDKKSCYLRCSRNRRTGQCTAHSIRLSNIEDIIEPLCFSCLTGYLEREEILRQIIKELEQREGERKEKRKKQAKQGEWIQKAIADLYVDHAMGRISDAAFTMTLEELKGQIEKLQAEYFLLEEEKTGWKELLMDHRNLLPLTPALCNVILDRIEIGEMPGREVMVVICWKGQEGGHGGDLLERAGKVSTD